MRLFVIENNLQNKLGHFFNLALSFKREVDRRGIESHFYVNRAADRDVCRPLGARPVFRYRSADETSQDCVGGPVKDLRKIGHSFARGCRALVHAGVDANDVVFVSTAQHREVYGMALWMSKLSPDNRPFLFVNYHWADFIDPQTGAENLRAPLLRYATQALVAQCPQERVIFAAQTDALAAQIQQVTDHPVHRYPVPLSYDFAGSYPAAADDPPQGPPVIAIMGRSLARKGTAVVPELVRMMAERPSPVRFKLQLTSEFADLGSPAMAHDLASRPNVEVLSGALSEVEYYDHLARSDIVLLPYDRREYMARSSGVFCDAAGFGKVSVVPSGTWMAEQIVKGYATGITYPSDDVQSIADAVASAVTDLPELLVRSRERAASWRHAQSASAFVEQMVEHVGAVDNVRS